jgi:hypothetical protein
VKKEIESWVVPALLGFVVGIFLGGFGVRAMEEMTAKEACPKPLGIYPSTTTPGAVTVGPLARLPNIREAVDHGLLKRGMTPAQVVYVLGDPNEKNICDVGRGENAQWCYGTNPYDEDAGYVYFGKGRVDSWQFKRP